MAELPRHPETEEATTAADRRSAGSTPWGTYAFLAVVVVGVLTMILLHLSGVVGPGAHSR